MAGEGGSRTHLPTCMGKLVLKTSRATGPYPLPDRNLRNICLNHLNFYFFPHFPREIVGFPDRKKVLAIPNVEISAAVGGSLHESSILARRSIRETARRIFDWFVQVLEIQRQLLYHFSEGNR